MLGIRGGWAGDSCFSTEAVERSETVHNEGSAFPTTIPIKSAAKTPANVAEKTPRRIGVVSSVRDVFELRDFNMLADTWST